jgi:hypothetical protein
MPMISLLMPFGLMYASCAIGACQLLRLSGQKIDLARVCRAPDVMISPLEVVVKKHCHG